MCELMTIGDIARKLGIPRARLEYAVEKAGIQERGRAGILRLFSPDQVPVIEAALATVRSRTTQTVGRGGDDEHANS